MILFFVDVTSVVETLASFSILLPPWLKLKTIVVVDVVSKVKMFVYRLHKDWCDILSRSTIDVVLS